MFFCSAYWKDFRALYVCACIAWLIELMQQQQNTAFGALQSSLILKQNSKRASLPTFLFIMRNSPVLSRFLPFVWANSKITNVPFQRLLCFHELSSLCRKEHLNHMFCVPAQCQPISRAPRAFATRNQTLNIHLLIHERSKVNIESLKIHMAGFLFNIFRITLG